MINLASRDVLHGWGKFLFTGIGLGLLIGATLTMAGVFRGMVDDGQVLIDNSGADLWVVQQGTLGPYAEPSSLRDDVWRGIAGIQGVAETGNAAFLTIQMAHAGKDTRVMIVGIEVDRPNRPGTPPYLTAGRPILQGHYEAIADERAGLKLGERVKIRRHDYTVVGLTRRMVSSSGDPMIFVPLKDAQEIQFLKDNDALVNERVRTAANPSFNRPGVPGLLEAAQASATQARNVNTVLVRLVPGADPAAVANEIQRWKRLTAYTKTQMEDILIAKLIATSAKQIGMFLVILAIVTAAIVAFIIYTMTLAKVREIAVLKLIGAKNRIIAGMILQQALALGVIGFLVGRTAAGLWGPAFPKYVLLLPQDAIGGFAIVMTICALASSVAIRAALAIDPAEAIGG
ncbi:MAG: ABC transporter permease [Candidatus Nitricoxidivorans perseverans]|jgi:putative ABC transport system permease protein|uniref:ABC transporter permease n=1 Tax=Candidatus Nitricoxidivorans perseverans TaxID=2975601 RepID=A0AA49FLQ5_9PROT|nr:MAG: ABC transporter permease [Candidatus Nitricoxidivorans perseverans]